ncbi:MAG: hypothetical protein LUH18_08665 [Oscillospiraceae bacterium]|nr:hypothetical protein [Oscillospiraceae bacterium]
MCKLKFFEGSERADLPEKNIFLTVRKISDSEKKASKGENVSNEVTEKRKPTRERKRIDRKRYYGKTANLYPKRAWTAEENKLVLEHSIPDSELSKKIQRSVKSIQEKRRRLRTEQSED